jgi:hypothetical protein
LQADWPFAGNSEGATGSLMIESALDPSAPRLIPFRQFPLSLLIPINTEFRRVVKHHTAPAALEECRAVIAVASRHDHVLEVDVRANGTAERHRQTLATASQGCPFSSPQCDKLYSYRLVHHNAEGWANDSNGNRAVTIFCDAARLLCRGH